MAGRGANGTRDVKITGNREDNENMADEFDLSKPAHLIANDVLRRLELIALYSGLQLTFGVQSHDVIAGLVTQYQNKLMPPPLSNAQAWVLQAEDEQEAWLRERLKALRFPAVEDVYVSAKFYFYVSFERLLTKDEINIARGAANLQIERTPPLRNRYRVVFEAPDVEEA